MSDESVDVFSFMALRACERLESSASRSKFIRDDYYHVRGSEVLENHTHHLPADDQLALPTGVHDMDLFSPNALSPVGKRLFAAVQARRSTAEIISGVEAMLLGGFDYPFGDDVQPVPIVRAVDVSAPLPRIDAMRLGTLSARLHYRIGNSLRILPDSPGDIEAPLGADLVRASAVIATRIASDTPTAALDLKTLFDNLADTLASPVTDYVFDRATGRYTASFLITKRIYFDALYALYVLRKREKVNLEPAIVALRTLHALELLAISQFFTALEAQGAASTYATSSTKFRAVLDTAFPRLSDWSPGLPEFARRMREADVPLPATLAQLRTLTLATPIVNPVFARFPTRFMPFSSITPIGIGDLKVVKQKFLGYRKGEIAHIETVLAGETKTRVHRALEKTEETVSLSTENSSEINKDSQSTDRYELKREAESVIKTDIGVNANASVTYNNTMVVASVAAGFSFANSRSETNRASANLVNEVIAKATSRIVSRTSEQRSRTTIFETEETNSHGFANPATNGNISGIYRWLDKVYEARIHNFGKRMMFEFIVPEPAAFFVSSRLQGYAASLNLPDYPKDASSGGGANTPQLPVQSAAEITEEMWESVLKAKYNVGDLTPPPPSVDVAVSQANGVPSYIKNTPFNDRGLLLEDYASQRMGAPANYALAALKVSGTMQFRSKNEAEANWQNTLQIRLNNNVVFEKIDEQFIYWTLEGEQYGITTITEIPTSFTLTIATKTCVTHVLRVALVYNRTEAAMAAWRTAVYARMLAAPPPAESAPVIDSRITAYEEALKKIEPPQLNELFGGRSPDANATIIRNELKRECISIIAQEFDTLSGDDVISSINAMGTVNVVQTPGGSAAGIVFPSFTIVQGSKDSPQTHAHYIDKADGAARYPAINLAKAQLKGRYVQFLEQAFEWEHLSQVFHPYFWATPPRWVELMAREDIADPVFTDFLRAGSARVLLAVRPGYENAVLHFLATREPWDGGPSPVIGDPLYVPLYEEIRGQQDTLAGSEPVGDPWTFSLPTSLIYLESTEYPLTNEYIPPVP